MLSSYNNFRLQNGKYEEPTFMSPESRRFIKSMLQVDPKNRITLEEILSHTWLTSGYLDPVDYTSTDAKKYDKECISVMSSYYEVSPERMWRHLKKWKYDYHTATYFLLLSKKKRGATLRLNTLPAQMYLKMRIEDTPRKDKTQLQPLMIIQPDELKNNELVTTPYFDCEADVEVCTPKKAEETCSSPIQFVQPAKPTGVRKPLKRMRSPTLGGENSPGKSVRY